MKYNRFYILSFLVIFISSLTAKSVFSENSYEPASQITLNFISLRGVRGLGLEAYWRLKEKTGSDVPFHWWSLETLVQMTPSILQDFKQGYDVQAQGKTLAQRLNARQAQELVDYIKNPEIVRASRSYDGGLLDLSSFFRSRFMSSRVSGRDLVKKEASYQFLENFLNTLVILYFYDRDTHSNFSQEAGLNFIKFYGSRLFNKSINENYPIQIRSGDVVRSIWREIFRALVNSNDPQALEKVVSELAKLETSHLVNFLLINDVNSKLYPERYNPDFLAEINFSIVVLAELVQSGHFTPPKTQDMVELFQAFIDIVEFQKMDEKGLQGYYTDKQIQILNQAVSYFQKLGEPLLVRHFKLKINQVQSSYNYDEGRQVKPVPPLREPKIQRVQSCRYVLKS